MNKKTIGLDLGTSFIRIWTKENGIILREPTVVSLNKVTGRVEKVGFEAKKILGKTASGNVYTVCPVTDGVIAGVDETVKLLYTLLKQVNLQNAFSRPSVIVGVSELSTAVDRGAVMDAVYRAGAKSGGVALVREPIAAALGAGVRIEKPRGNMVVDIGCGTVQVVILCFNRIVVSRASNIASGAFDMAIINYMHDHYGINIGVSTAEETKIRIGSIIPTADRKSGILTGLNHQKRMPEKISVNSNMIADALREQSIAVVKLVKSALEVAPPEICSDIYDNGITLTGGGALIGGMAQLLASNIGVPIKIANAPQDAVINGIARIIDENLDQYIEYLP